MIGGKPDIVERLHPIFETPAPAADKGWGHVGPHGAGNYVKIVHNGIEYGMMQAFAEGFYIMKSREEFGLDLAQISKVWRKTILPACCLPCGTRLAGTRSRKMTRL
jgi:6-phosphogluconate dehydrogenase